MLHVSVILGWNFPTHLLNKPIASSVRWFQSTGAGINELMADTSIPENITITRIVNQFGGYISEYVFSFILYIVKDMQRMRQAKLEHRWVLSFQNLLQLTTPTAKAD